MRKTKGGGRGSGDVSPKGKQKELEVFPDGPLHGNELPRISA